MNVSKELYKRLTHISTNQSGNFEVDKATPDIRSEFIWLCREHYRNSPDMGCGSCVMKYVEKILKDFVPIVEETKKKRTRKKKVEPTEVTQSEKDNRPLTTTDYFKNKKGKRL